MPYLRPFSFSVALLGFALALPAAAADANRGRALYEQRCGQCHTESVHGRTQRAARSFGDIRAWVTRWSSTLELGWGAGEVDDVTLYLNETYYRFAVPARVARAPIPASTLAQR